MKEIPSNRLRDVGPVGKHPCFSLEEHRHYIRVDDSGFITGRWDEFLLDATRGGARRIPLPIRPQATASRP